MRTRTHRTVGAAFLLLLIVLSSLATTDWFCPDGQACLPGLSPVCCCGCGPANAAIGPPSIGIPHRTGHLAHLSKRGCGCYRDLSNTAPLRSLVQIVVAAPAILTAPGLMTPKPGARPEFPRVAPVSLSVPRFALPPGDTRAPPAA